MNQIEYFKNFPMAKEIEIAGHFIYTSMKSFCQLDSFWNECDIFYILYTASVGIERLQKVLLVLAENNTDDDIAKLEKDLITHSHQDLQNRIKNRLGLSLNSNQNKFIAMLTSFYKSCRYDRFTMGSAYEKEKELLIKFLSSGLNREIVANSFFGNTPNDQQFKKFYCKNLGSIARAYHSLISSKAREQNIFTYELNYNSSAGKLFYPHYEDDAYYKLFEEEVLARKEYLLFLIQNADKTECGKFIKSIPALDLDEGLYNSYISTLVSGNLTLSEIDEITSEYDYEVTNKKERLNTMDAIGNPLIIFEDDLDELDY